MLVPNKTFRFESFGMTDVGIVREHNEDAWAAYPEKGVFILADGMGGHSAGEIASKEAVESLYALIQQWEFTETTSLEEAKKFFRTAYLKVNARIHERSEKDEGLKGMGTTLSSLFFINNLAILAHVGDSRIYRLRHACLQQLTEDHSLVAELLALGAMHVDEIDNFPYKHILTRAVGTHSKVECTIQETKVEAEDIFLLCSDGLTNYITNKQIEKILLADCYLSNKAQMLIDLAIEQGGGDNITLILVNASHDLSR